MPWLKYSNVLLKISCQKRRYKLDYGYFYLFDIPILSLYLSTFETGKAMSIILNEYEEEQIGIRTHSSADTPIINSQSKILLFSEVNYANSFEADFDSKFQGNADPYYNCHGLTFACKRTGIYQNSEIWKIINEEYRPIKSEGELLVGDVILYLSSDEQEILHSGIVVRANYDPIPDIKIYSKILKGREIIHHPRKCTYYTQFNATIKYYRISHAGKFRQLT